MMTSTETGNAARILVVEDDAVVGRDVRETLVDLGYRVLGVVSTGADAVRATREHSPDVVLMDVRMPGPVDGIDTARRIGRETTIPVVYLTAYSDPETLSRAAESRPSGYLLKPFDARELGAAMELALGGSPGGREPDLLEEATGTWTEAPGAVVPPRGPAGPESRRPPSVLPNRVHDPVDLSGLLTEIHDEVSLRVGRSRDVFLSVSGGPHPVWGPEAALRRMVRGLALLVARAAPSGGRICVRLEGAGTAARTAESGERQDEPRSGWCRLSVAATDDTSYAGAPPTTPETGSIGPEARTRPEIPELPDLHEVRRLARDGGGELVVEEVGADGAVAVGLYLPRTPPDDSPS